MRNYTIEDNGAGTALLLAEAGVSWPLLLHEVALLGWGGLEFGVGIPGTLGGAVISNAGAHNSELGNVLEWIEILDARGSSAAAEDEISYPIVRRLQHDQLDLSYRYSRFRERRQFRFDDQGGIILPARGMIEPAEIVMLLGIRLHREDSGQLQARIAEYKLHRKMTEPPAYRAGTIFKEPTGYDVDSLLAQVGMKGRTYGKAQISTANANYIMNLGEARAMDIAALIAEAHRRVLDRLGIDLELDVELRGAWGSGDETASDQEKAPVIGQVTKVYPYVHPLLEMDEEQSFSQD
jgi:UDP-N-acetylmuramate dehydrogenase